MIRSMTAFARQEQQESWGQVCWEIRSVNHRYLDISIRLPEEFRSLEPILREQIRQNLKRGKVDCTLYLQIDKANQGKFQVNLPLVNQLWTAIQQVDTLTGNHQLPDSIDILRWPGVLETTMLDLEQIHQTVISYFHTTLSALIEGREREGTQLAVLIEQRCVAVAQEILNIRGELPMIIQAQHERLKNRLAELVELNSDRIEQELAILIQKMDVAEELDRIEAHLQESRQTLAQGEAVGRRLDFLVQELHREANTLGAKSAHITTSRSAVELKVLIEQMREQIQNIE